MRKGVISIEVLIVVVLAIIVLIVLGGYFVQKFRATTEQAEKPIESIEKQTCAYYNGGCYNSCDPSQQLKVPRPSSGRWIDCGLKECCVSLEKLKIPKTETVPKSVTEEFLDSKPLIPIEEVAVLDCPSKNHLVSREFTFKKEVKRETVTAFELTQERVELREDCNIKMSEVNEKLSNLCKTKKCSNTSEKKCSKNPKPLGSYVVFNENKKSPTYTGDLPSIEFTCDIVMLCECAEEKIST